MLPNRLLCDCTSSPSCVYLIFGFLGSFQADTGCSPKHEDGFRVCFWERFLWGMIDSGIMTAYLKEGGKQRQGEREKRTGKPDGELGGCSQTDLAGSRSLG